MTYVVITEDSIMPLSNTRLLDLNDECVHVFCFIGNNGLLVGATPLAFSDLFVRENN